MIKVKKKIRKYHLEPSDKDKADKEKADKDQADKDKEKEAGKDKAGETDKDTAKEKDQKSEKETGKDKSGQNTDSTKPSATQQKDAPAKEKGKLPVPNFSAGGIATPADAALTFECELGYTFDPAVWGQGYATEAACRVRDYARDVLRLSYVISAILPSNASSRRVAERSGARHDGQMQVVGLTFDRYLWPLATGGETRLQPLTAAS